MHLVFPILEITKFVLAVSSLTVSLNVTLMIKILQKIMKMLSEKMLKTKLSGFHDNKLKKSNSLDGCSDESRYMFVTSPPR